MRAFCRSALDSVIQVTWCHWTPVSRGRIVLTLDLWLSDCGPTDETSAQPGGTNGTDTSCFYSELLKVLLEISQQLQWWSYAARWSSRGQRAGQQAHKGVKAKKSVKDCRNTNNKNHQYTGDKTRFYNFTFLLKVFFIFHIRIWNVKNFTRQDNKFWLVKIWTWS